MSKKNKISEQEVKKIAELSRLSLTSKELKKRTEDMNNSLREDNYESSLDKKDVLANSPSSNSDYVEVPLTVKKESQ